MKLPKLYALTKIKFSSLRDGMGENYGIILDIDTDVIRNCRRVLCDDGWKWQIVNYNRDKDWDYGLRQDKEILDDDGSELDFEYA